MERAFLSYEFDRNDLQKTGTGDRPKIRIAALQESNSDRPSQNPKARSPQPQNQTAIAFLKVSKFRFLVFILIFFGLKT